MSNTPKIPFDLQLFNFTPERIERIVSNLPPGVDLNELDLSDWDGQGDHIPEHLLPIPRESVIPNMNFKIDIWKGNMDSDIEMENCGVFMHCQYYDRTPCDKCMFHMSYMNGEIILKCNSKKCKFCNVKPLKLGMLDDVIVPTPSAKTFAIMEITNMLSFPDDQISDLCVKMRISLEDLARDKKIDKKAFSRILKNSEKFLTASTVKQMAKFAPNKNHSLFLHMVYKYIEHFARNIDIADMYGYENLSWITRENKRIMLLLKQVVLTSCCLKAEARVTWFDKLCKCVRGSIAFCKMLSQGLPMSSDNELLVNHTHIYSSSF
ncbi:unnamed protein product [Caenorhabditis bovis]|uniref:Uncharacterized protein n=1 Tax=Caenorhabditis bovis TaxID=2654633 RepID=A0A8S1EIR7_9PELO|nr:unnamed protein product [Caenorhabditis bovis]